METNPKTSRSTDRSQAGTINASNAYRLVVVKLGSRRARVSHVMKMSPKIATSIVVLRNIDGNSIIYIYIWSRNTLIYKYIYIYTCYFWIISMYPKIDSQVQISSKTWKLQRVSDLQLDWESVQLRSCSLQWLGSMSIDVPDFLDCWCLKDTQVIPGACIP